MYMTHTSPFTHTEPPKENSPTHISDHGSLKPGGERHQQRADNTPISVNWTLSRPQLHLLYALNVTKRKENGKLKVTLLSTLNVLCLCVKEAQLLLTGTKWLALVTLGVCTPTGCVGQHIQKPFPSPQKKKMRRQIL